MLNYSLLYTHLFLNFTSGGPVHLDVSEYEDNLHLLEQLLEDEGERPAVTGQRNDTNWQVPSGPAAMARAPPTNHTTNTSHNSDYCLPSYLDQFRMEIPHLAHLADGLILSTRIHDLLKMESNSIKRQTADRGRTLEAKLTKNQEDVLSTSMVIPAGHDNRLNDLHMARFMPAAIATAQELWLRAREVWGLNGYPAVASFDLAAVGLDGHVCDRGWVEIQDPSSTGLSAKQFNLSNNCSKVAADKRITLSSGEDSFEVREALKEASTLHSFKMSIRAIREAARLTMPWNSSFSALEGFLVANNYMAKDVGSSQQAVTVLSEFSDHVFSLNAGRWRAKKTFLDFIELGSVWSSWLTSRGGSLGTHRQQQPSSSGSSSQQPQQQRKKPQQDGKQKQPRAAPPRPAATRPADDICKRWNLAKCPNAASGVCRTSAGLVLRHVCNFIKTDGSRCCASHMRVNH